MKTRKKVFCHVDALRRGLVSSVILFACITTSMAQSALDAKPVASPPAAEASIEIDPTLPTLPKGLFESVGMKATQALIGAASAQESPRILLDVPDIYDREAAIPVRIKVALPGVESIIVLLDREPRPAVAGLAMRPVQDPEIAFVISTKKTGIVKALVKSEGKWFYVQKTLRLATQSWK